MVNAEPVWEPWWWPTLQIEALVPEVEEPWPVGFLLGPDGFPIREVRHPFGFQSQKVVG